MKNPRMFLALLLCLLLVVSVLPAAFAADPDSTVSGKVTEIEKYGHAELDITIEDFSAAGFDLGDVVTVTTGSFSSDMPYLNGYYVEQGEYLLRAYPGTENIAVCINYGSFADIAGVAPGDEVTIAMKEKAGALALQEINNLVYSNDRQDYDSDEEFANFRPVVMGDIAEGALYRSASPVDDIFGRADCADQLAENAGIRSVMNLASNEEEILSAFEEEDFSSDYYRMLCEDDRVIALGLPISFDTIDFAQGIVRGLTFLS